MKSFADVMKDSPAVADVHAASTSRRVALTDQESAVVRREARRRRLRRLFVRPNTDDPKAIAPAPKARRTQKADAEFSIAVPITKIDDELQTVYGWASVIHKDGAIVTDQQGDQISETEMVKAAHDFVSSSRHGGLLHALQADGQPHRGGEVVESLVMTPDVQKGLGIDLGHTGWFIGYRVNDPDAWALVKSGTLKAFSIGGRAVRVPVVAAV